MARKKNDGRGRLGGRAMGTPNKTTGAVKSAISQIVEGYISSNGRTNKPTLAKDLESMQPGERAKLMAGLASYIVPKQQALTVEDQTRVEYDSLMEFLETAPESAINAIAEKVLEMQEKNTVAKQ